ncbi:recombinase family protein [Streptomyces sp. NBC_01142]|uniref:recombinase family protein n=1 Tax=Streptomyces sp. NBC_01142 TaxID=2975865 RepID=UPI002258B8CB|nr:recombinase family protein [Streptomyces sp. NBC_01142]MCX4819000.1 recombinase family protein [Streptomyces sp. NBC_01142]
MRGDHVTLVGLGLSPDELKAMGLDEPATAEPSGLMDAYLRRSNKREDLATLRGHLRDLVRWAETAGLQIRHVWFDQLSASKTYVRRREFEKATQAIMNGESRTLGVWKTDRFDRRGMGAVGRMLDEFDRRHSRLVSVSEGLDSAKGGRMVFAILSERAREESKDIAKRVQIGHDSHKAEGRRGTGRPPFGLYSARGSGKVEHHTEEYETARRLADLLLDRKSTKDTAHKLNEEGHRTRSGATWSPTAVSKLAQSPLFAGMVPVRQRKADEHGNPMDSWEGYGEPLRNEKGEIVMCGKGVVTPAEWFRIKALIAERTDERWARGKPEAKYLGTGSYRCGRMRDKQAEGKLDACGGPMSHRGGRYRCEVRQTRGKSICEGVVTLAERIDFAVGQAWVNHITALAPDDPVIIEIARRWLAFADPETRAKKEETQKALEAAQQRVKKLEEDFYVYGKMDEERFEELSERLCAVIDSTTVTLENLDAEADLAPLTQIENLRQAWEEADTADRRMLLKCALGERGITVKPAARQGDHTPILERLEFDWLSRWDVTPAV